MKTIHKHKKFMNKKHIHELKRKRHSKNKIYIWNKVDVKTFNTLFPLKF